MKPLLRGPAIRPRRLDAEARQAFEARLYAIHRRIFDGVDLEAFRRYVIDSWAHETRIRLFRNAAGEDVGYITFQVFLLPGGLRPKRVLKTQAGLLPEYRRYNASFRLLFWECVFHFISRGFPETYFFATPVSPVPYALACRYLKQVYPQPGLRTPARFRDVFARLAERFRPGASVPGHPLSYDAGWIVRASDAHRRRMEASEDPRVRFYLAQNPGYAQGHGMAMLVPFNLQNGWHGAWHLLRRRLRSLLRTRSGLIHPFVLLRAAFGR